MDTVSFMYKASYANPASSQWITQGESLNDIWANFACDADPLFMSYAWRHGWWEIWGSDAGCLQLLLCNDAQGPLGLAPMYLDRARLWKGIRYSRLQMIGSSYGALSTPRAEYNSFLLRPGAETEAFACLATTLEKLSWQECVLEDVRVGSVMEQAIKDWSAHRGWTLREILQDTAYAVETSGSFQDYLAGLGSNTRLKLFNRRKLLSGMGEVRVSNLFPGDVDAFFKLLNEFHRTRWGSDCFGARSLDFHSRLIASLAAQGAGIELSLLALDGRPLSVLYNIRMKGRVYNLQSGYLEHFHPKISLGSLHLGYAIEHAFADPTVNHFDFLAGKGKQTDYKKLLTRQSVSLKSYKLVRSLPLRLLYKIKDVLEKRWVR